MSTIEIIKILIPIIIGVSFLATMLFFAFYKKKGEKKQRSEENPDNLEKLEKSYLEKLNLVQEKIELTIQEKIIEYQKSHIVELEILKNQIKKTEEETESILFEFEKLRESIKSSTQDKTEEVRVTTDAGVQEFRNEIYDTEQMMYSIWAEVLNLEKPQYAPDISKSKYYFLEKFNKPQEIVLTVSEKTKMKAWSYMFMNMKKYGTELDIDTIRKFILTHSEFEQLLFDQK